MRDKLEKELKKWGWNEDYAKELEERRRRENVQIEESEFLRLQSALNIYEPLHVAYQNRHNAHSTLAQHIVPMVHHAPYHNDRYRKPSKSKLNTIAKETITRESSVTEHPTIIV